MGRASLKISVDTNVLVRLIVRDSEQQAAAALKLIESAELIAISLPCLCEVVWVLRSVYNLPSSNIAESIQALQQTTNVAMDYAAVEIGLGMMKEGGDFADAVIAFDSARLGGQTFVTFDRRAVSRLAKLGLSAEVLVT